MIKFPCTYIRIYNIFFILVQIRLKSLQNIQKITKTMQMVSAAKYSRADRELKPARVYGTGAKGLFKLTKTSFELLSLFVFFLH